MLEQRLLLWGVPVVRPPVAIDCRTTAPFVIILYYGTFTDFQTRSRTPPACA